MAPESLEFGMYSSNSDVVGITMDGPREPRVWHVQFKVGCGRYHNGWHQRAKSLACTVQSQTWLVSQCMAPESLVFGMYSSKSDVVGIMMDGAREPRVWHVQFKVRRGRYHNVWHQRA